MATMNTASQRPVISSLDTQRRRSYKCTMAQLKQPNNNRQKPEIKYVLNVCNNEKSSERLKQLIADSKQIKVFKVNWNALNQ